MLAVLEVVPSVSPIYGNAPAFKTFTVSSGLSLLDYTSTSLNLRDPTGQFVTYV